MIDTVHHFDVGVEVLAVKKLPYSNSTHTLISKSILGYALGKEQKQAEKKTTMQEEAIKA